MSHKPGGRLPGTMSVNSLPKTVTRQRRAWDFWSRAFLRMSPSWVRFLVYNTGLVQYRWTGLDLLTADRLKIQDWKIVNSLKYSLSCCTYVFHRCRHVLAFSVLAFSALAYSYLRIPYLRFQTPRISNKYRTAVDQFWFTDWLACYQWLTDCHHVRHFAATSFSLLQQVCTVDNGIFLYGWCEHHFVSELNNEYFTRH